MNQNLLHTIILAAGFLVLFASAELLYHKMRIQAEITRKYVHVATGLITMLFPVLIDNHWYIMALCASFLLILLVSLRLNFLPSINAVDRLTRGSILYPIIVYGCYLVYQEYGQFIYYYLPILILALCDPVAALVGKRLPFGKYKVLGNTKTFAGSLAFFGAACITTLVTMYLNEDVFVANYIWVAVGVGIPTAIAEGVTNRGYDNLTIPGSALLVLIIVRESTDLL